jgi:hypothetical protein
MSPGIMGQRRCSAASKELSCRVAVAHHMSGHIIVAEANMQDPRSRDAGIHTSSTIALQRGRSLRDVRWLEMNRVMLHVDGIVHSTVSGCWEESTSLPAPR